MTDISQTQARVAGWLYLGTIVAGIYAQVFTRMKLAVADNPAATTSSILAHESLYRSGLAADAVMLFCYIAVTIIFLGLFKGVDAMLSRIAAGFSMIGIAVLSITGIFHAAPMLLLQNAPYLDADMQQQLARLALDLHTEGYIISLLFFGAYCLLLGVLIWRSRLIPNWVGALMMAGGAAHLFNNFAFILAPDFARQIPDLFNYPPLLGELALALWLVFFGIRTAGDS
ncbi:DUF4386 domain-containing protein [Sphingorhabdus pulchriflava]|uniref:DUF4386 domain-containing protein n=1 Tax=Sphingorhabdus pulchriflava TaxID=2292257 RepID=A0A371BJ66_9SPHN|nr:DUF4386 domain-containing protein [Sphingorhabdus pulchriflava]RDV07629.1 DUF4386 domain-containing protein [Sphingorhabdus pulchriflava]